jgi:hypothetical protein
MKQRVTNWRVYESSDGQRFVMGRVHGGIHGPLRFESVELIGPPGGDELVSYYLETGWNVDRMAREVTDDVWASMS